MNITRMAIVGLALVGVVGCADRPFLRADPPATKGGVTVSLVGQKCGRTAFEETYNELILDMVVQVRNGGTAPVEVEPAQMRLAMRGTTVMPVTGAASVVIAPETTSNIPVHFERAGNATCNEQMTLSLDRSVQVSGAALTLQPLSFVPGRWHV
jgi:hypothetical protein